MAARLGRRAALAVTLAVVTHSSLGAGVWRSTTSAGAAGPDAAVPAATAEFNERKDRYIDAMIEAEPQHFDHDAAVGLLLLERAQRTGDRADVERANELILSSLRRIEASLGTNEFGVVHGAPLTFIRLVLQFGGDPQLLYPETVDAIVRGEFPDGSLEPQHSLLAYRDQLFGGGYDAENLGLDVRAGEPWDPARYDEYNGTENHKLQAIVTGMLLADIYAGDTVGGVPVKDDTAALDDQWHYFRDAFFRYSDTWADGRADHFTADVMQTEEDSIQYLGAHLGDYWLVRDLYSDAVVRDHAEVLIDRLLADWVEDLVGPLHTGAVERVSDIDLDHGLSFQEHVINYLLFDNLGEPLPVDNDELFDFGGWGNLAVATTDYVPGSPDFPMVLVDIATDKGSGYTVREGGSDHNWVETDFSLGFRLDAPLFVEDMVGGFQVVADPGGAAAGRMVTVFHGESPFSKDKPTVHPMGVQSGRTALMRTVARDDPARLWVQSSLDSVVAHDGWVFVEQESWSGRTVYLAVGAGRGTLEPIASIEGGDVFEFERGDTAVWEVATSDEVPSLAGFIARVLDSELTVEGDAVDFVSPFSGVSLHLEDDPALRTVDGEPVDWNAYAFSFSTPWGSHALGETTGSVARDGQSVRWDWQAAAAGSYDQPPDKQVVNAGT